MTLNPNNNPTAFQTDTLGPLGPSWLVEERDACGVGFIADQQGRASHKLVADTLTALSCMEHRGGCCADQDSGDGAGIMTAIPWGLLQAWASSQEIKELPRLRTGVAMVFLPQAQLAQKTAVAQFEEAVRAAGLTFVGWREVPVAPETLGPLAKEFQPKIAQAVVTAETAEGDELERSLFLARRRFEKAIAQLVNDPASDKAESDALKEAYVCSFSSRTIVYKGMVRSEVLGRFYKDLQNPAYESEFAVYHRRFSTNTLPKWPLAHPMRLLGHNGEINTLVGNINWMKAREANLSHPSWGDDLALLKPVVNADNSDSANLDNTMELLVRTGRSPAHALTMLVPEAYHNQPELAKYPEIVDYYEYYSSIQEPWDGPALIVFCDGKQVGATLDRNGLRPARYVVTKDGYVVVSSEAGVVNIPVEDIVEKGRLGPGQMLAVNFEEKHEILHNWDIKQRIAEAQPYGQWLAERRQEITPQLFSEEMQLEKQDLLTQQTAFGTTAEDMEMIIHDMAAQGKEPTFCMGNDTPLAVLSDKPHLIYNYFKQRFAQVTNPPIDPLRERLVMSLTTQLGAQGNLLEEHPEQARLLKINSPVLNDTEMAMIRSSDFAVSEISTLYAVEAGPQGLEAAVRAICDRAVEAVKSGNEILILSDRKDAEGNTVTLSEIQTYIPPLVAVGAVHHHLIAQGLRMKASIVVDTAQCWSTHHFACLLGYGATAICPYLTLESVRHWWHDKKTQKQMESGKLPVSTLNGAQANFRKAVENGLLKILSKMGISLLSSYRGAQIFEAIGIGSDLKELSFKGSVSRLGGLSIAELAQETMSFHEKAFPELTRKRLENMGFIQSRPSGEYHMNNPAMTKLLHKAVETKQYDHYEVYREQLKGRPVAALRDLLDFRGDRNSIEISEVEPVEAIMQRFCTGGMSLGSLSREAHETLGIAMNRIGGKSNSGEGGEDAVRFKILDDVDSEGLSETLPHLKGLENGDTASSAIKQVASGRFGVTPEYLMSAKQIEIKMAQGAKPGEGGQLPGKKVSEYIASLRKSKPGVTLISPPPHHDIYSIEDLAQLIFDLHQINPNAGVSVKLVAEVGIGTIAAGVAKANADVIQISGHDGGTGASPLSSIKHAGLPWELGLTEVHRSLMENGLRDRVLLRVDGGLKTGWDVVMGALMGAEEYGFGSIAMIAEGCIMARVCHTNQCPVGVATQQEALRKRFSGTPGKVVNFFYFIAQEVRSLLAKLGYRSLNEIVGRADLLVARDDVTLAKTKALDLSALVQLPDVKNDRTWLEHGEINTNGPVLDDEILADAEVADAIAHHTNVTKSWDVINTDRTVGARISGAIAKQYGNTGFAGALTLNFNGSVGQSFGAFNLSGMKMTLTGEANDYVGKGMNGGEIIIKPFENATYKAEENVIVGNTCIYGASGGTLYVNGIAGERFAVRNSKGTAVLEGAGDHCCEYMTGGVVVVLGSVGRNVGAGMTGGLGYFLDESGDFQTRVNPEIVQVQRILTEAGEQQLKSLIEAHADRTGSEKAKRILADWQAYLPKFWQVVPPSEADSAEAGVQKNVAASSAV